MKIFFTYLTISALCLNAAVAQNKQKEQKGLTKRPKVLYGTASFYADKFEGRETANGEIFSQKKMTAACNVLPLGTWIRVTNLRNGRSVVVKVNDHLYYRMKRVVDLSKAAARKIGHVDGLIKVKVEVLGRKEPF
jgi:peptidoglycan lytic transglycosylase